VLLDSVFAQVRYVVRTQKEQVEGARETAIQEVHFDIRYDSNLNLNKVTMIDYEGSRFDVITIMERGRKQYVTVVTQWRDNEASA